MAINDKYRQLLSILPDRWSQCVLYLVNWLFQGQLFADRRERIAKTVFSGVLFGLTYTTVSERVDRKWTVPLSLLVSHTLNWVAATNIHSTREKGYTEQYDRQDMRARFTPPVRLVRSIVGKAGCLHAACIFGSLARGDAHTRSDIDIHIYARSGFRNLVGAYIVLFVIRLVCNVSRYPIDIWVFTDLSRTKPAKGETPIIIVDEDEFLKHTLCEYNHISESEYLSF